MNKKFLSAVLFGALMVSSTGTFTSCKDYDDDIDNLQGQIDGVKSQIAALESKINEGKWITNVTPSAEGLTITMSDGQTFNITNGKNGTDGAAGTPGTEWTISEDGFWVCNGEKTDVKAVGEKGEAGQQEVKFENGKWYLWNGTEFVEFKASAETTGNVPYYYTDPNDQNYAILVVYDKDGKNEKTLRLPLNEGLAQITVVQGNTLSFNYAISKEGAGWASWNGPKAKPAKGEYIVTQSNNQLMVQVTPANYDLSGAELKIVDSKDQIVPVKVGKAEAYTGLITSSRATSPAGLYTVSVEATDITDANTETYATRQNGSKVAVALIVDDNVRSAFDGDFKFSLDKVVNNKEIKFGAWNSDFTQVETSANAVPAKDFALAVNLPKYLYDAFVTMYDASEISGRELTDTEKKAITQAKADSVKYGISFDGLTIKSNDKANGTVSFSVHYMNTIGKVRSCKVNLTYGTPETPAETFTEMGVTAHTAISNNKATWGNNGQYLIADFTPYFDSMSEAERLVWNADINSVNVEATGMEYNNVKGQTKWVYENAETGRTETKLITLVSVGNDLKDNKSYIWLGADNKVAAQAKDYKYLVLPLTDDYKHNNENIAIENGGTYTVKVALNNADDEAIAYVEVPFTIAEPSSASIASAYTPSAKYYKDGVFTLLNNETTSTIDMFSAGTFNFKNAQAKDKKFTLTIADDKASASLAAINGTTEAGKTYTLTGAKVKYINREYPMGDISVKFAKPAGSTFETTKSLVIANNGKLVLKYLTDIDNTNAEEVAKYFATYKVLDSASSIVDVTSVTVKMYNGNTEVTGAGATLDPDNKDLTINMGNIGNTNDVTYTLKLTINGEREVSTPIVIKGTAAQ